MDGILLIYLHLGYKLTAGLVSQHRRITLVRKACTQEEAKEFLASFKQLNHGRLSAGDIEATWQPDIVHL